MGRTLPFAGTLVVAFAFLWLQDERRQPATILIAAVLSAMLVGAAAFVPWRRLPARVEAMPPLALLAVAGLLTEWRGVESEFAPLAFLPLLWLALYGTVGEVCVAAAGAAAVFLSPLLVQRGPVIGVADVRSALLWSGVSAVGALAVHGLVRDLRRRALLASNDYLTGALNRRAWEERFPEEVGRARREGRPLTVAMIDLDDFKGFNDCHGHQAGDCQLREAAEAWARELRMTDLLARYGGDEFCVALPACRLSDAVRRMEQLAASTHGACPVSIGVASWDGLESPSALLRRADEALYEAKRAGGSRVVAAE